MIWYIFCPLFWGSNSRQGSFCMNIFRYSCLSPIRCRKGKTWQVTRKYPRKKPWKEMKGTCLQYKDCLPIRIQEVWCHGGSEGWHEVINSQHSQHPMNQRFAIVAKFTNRFLLPVNNRCWTWGVLPNLVLNNGISKWSCTLCISAYYTPGPHRTKKKQPRWHRSFRTTKKISLLARTCKNSARNRKSHGSFQDSKQLETFLWGGLHLTLKYPNPKYLHGFYGSMNWPITLQISYQVYEILHIA